MGEQNISPGESTAVNTESKSIRALCIIRRVAALSIADACRLLEDSKPDPSIVIRKPHSADISLKNRSAYVHTALLEAKELSGFRPLPHVPIEDTKERIRLNVPSLSENLEMRLGRVKTIGGKGNSEGFVIMVPRQPADSAQDIEREAIREQIQILARERLDYSPQYNWIKRSSELLIAYLPAGLEPTHLAKTAKLADEIVPPVQTLLPADFID